MRCVFVLAGLVAWLPGGVSFAATQPEVRRVLFIAGVSNEARGAHEFAASSRILAESLNRSGLAVAAEVSVGWPESDAQVDAADLLVLYSDGLEDHVAKGRAARLQQRMDAGRKLAVLHFALEAPEGDAALRKLLLDAVGGRFEAGWSVNPTWKVQGSPLPAHPAARGVGPLEVEDEWYYHMRFRAGNEGIRSLLKVLPPATSIAEDGPRTGNPTIRAEISRGEPQILAWTCENKNGSRGFGFTGGHFHRHWYDGNFRKLVLNGLVWAVGLEVPKDGVASPEPSTPLYATIDEAIARGAADDVKRHLARNPDLARGSTGAKLSPLHQAILRRKTNIVLLLLEHGADVQAPDTAGRTPIHMAVERGDVELVRALLQRKADLTKRDRVGWTPLHHAAAKNQLGIARLLLDGGANPNQLSELGGTPLHEAAAGGGVEMTLLLLERGTNPAVRSKPGVTALDLAREYKNVEVIKVLEQKQ